jgi:hypothetical protein
MRYIFTNEEKIPKPEDLDPTKFYTTNIISLTFENGDLIFRLEYIGEAYDKDGPPQCMFPLFKDTNVEFESCIHCLSKCCAGNCRESNYEEGE